LERKSGKIALDVIEDYPGYLANPPKGYQIIERFIANKVVNVMSSSNDGCRQKILDAGCGVGLLTSHMAKLARRKNINLEITGVDILPEMLNYAEERIQREGLKDVNFVEGDVTSLPFPDNSFDLVVAVFIFFLLNEKELDAFLNEVYRVTKPGGRFYFFHPHRDRLAWFMVYLITREKKEYELDVVKHGYTPSEMEKILRQSSLANGRPNGFCAKRIWGGLATEVSGYVLK